VTALADEYELISKMINESRMGQKHEMAINEYLTSLAEGVFTRYGFPEGNIKVFGDDKIRVVGAGLDADGALITAHEFKVALEEALGVRLGAYEYFRKGEMALFKCSSIASLSVVSATASSAASEKEISGDSTAFFGNGAAFFSVISDGMGSGREAKESSEFVTSYLSELLVSEVGISTAVSALSRVIRQKAGECTATLDLFRLDLIRGDALFVKCGAAPSFVKRDKSIFRIRSETAPIGLMKNVDAEKIRVEVKSGDVIIMLSDGVSASAEDSVWLLSYLSGEAPDDLSEYAEEILRLAKKNNAGRDDMSVSVIKIISKFD
jgi:serine phosphatase RsbU (regulator of sigma subunit)